MSKKKTVYPIHKMGKHCGYEEYEDGSIKIASYHSDRFDAGMNQEAALDSLLKAVTAQCYAISITITEERRRFWAAATEDYSLDSDTYDYTYNYEKKIIHKKENSMSDLQQLFSAQDKVARWKAELANATAQLELARIDERSAYLISQHKPVASLLINREKLRAILAYLLHGNLERLKIEVELL